MKGTIKTLAVAALMLAAGCATDVKPSNEKLQKALNNYFETHNECLYPAGLKFPYELDLGHNAATEKEKLDALMDSSLLKRQDAPAIKVYRYTLTPVGERAAPRFCYGHKTVTTIDSFTAPMKNGKFLETTVSYHATLMDIPVWVKTDKMTAAFPEMAKALSSPQPAQTTLENAGAGWQVPQ